MKFLVGRLLILAFVSSLPGAHAAEDGLSKLVVPLDVESPKTESAQKFLTEKLGPIIPKKAARPTVLITDNKQYILYGDLFGTGDSYALAEVPMDAGEPQVAGRVAFAHWRDGKWRLSGLFDISTVWRPKGWNKTDDYLPCPPAEHPFELRDFTGDGVPEVIIAGEVEKYYQQNYLLRFDRKTHSLRILLGAMARPALVGGYLRLHFNSGNKAIFEEWQYLRWSGEEFVLKASWHSESPYNDVDPPFVEAEISGPDSRSENLIIMDVVEGGAENESGRIITRDGKPYAEVHFVWRESLAEHPVENWDEMEEAWLFEKLTGLPRKLLPHREPEKVLGRFEDHGKVRITGNKEAIQRLEAPTNL